MTFININYKYNNLVGTKQLTDLVEQKLETLHKFVPDTTDALCDVEFEKVGAHHNGKVHRVEINLSVDGALYRAEATEESFERAIDVARNELDRELRSAKDKSETLEKKEGRALKSLLIED